MSLVKSGLALSLARLANQAVMFIGPIILVRLISVHDYGVYREFFIYVNIGSILGCFAVNRSLLYIIPKYGEYERQIVLQSILFVLLGSLVVVGAFWAIHLKFGLFGDFNYVSPLAVYLILFLNLDYVENLWLAKGQIRHVVSYTMTRSMLRLLAVIFCAWYYQTVSSMVFSLIVVELVRLLFVFAYTLIKYTRGAPGSKVSALVTKEQVIFFSPLAVMASLEAINFNIGQLIVSAKLGEEALAYFFVGSYAVMISSLVYGSVSDVLFPTVIRKDRGKILETLEPWRKVTNFYWLMMLALCSLGAAYAETIVIFLFSEAYRPAIPVFRLLMLASLIQCFDFNFIIRVLNKNVNSVLGYLVLIPINLGVTYLLIEDLGLFAPALAFLVAQMALSLILCARVLSLTGLKISELIDWGQIGAISSCFALSLPITYFFSSYLDQSIITAASGAVLFLIAYLMLLRLFKVEVVTDGISLFRERKARA